MEPRPR